MNALIVEDNRAFRHSLHQLLTGYFPLMHVIEASDGAHALQRALARRYDLVFMDVHLPDSSGLELTRRIKAVHADTRICVITSYAIPEYKEVAFQSGADYFMVKGDTTEQQIVAMIESLLADRRDH
ncbi:MAG: response regulator [Thiobacillaceae bacterium]